MLELHWEHWFGFMQRRLNFVFGVEHIGLQSFAQYRKFLRWIQWISVHIGADLFHMPGAPGTSSAIGHPAETKSNSCCIWSSVRPRWQSIWFFRPPQADLENGPKPIYLYIHNYYIITVNYIYIYTLYHHLYSLVFHVLFGEHPFHQRQVAKSTSGRQSHSQRSCLSAKDRRGNALTNSIPMLYPAHAFHISFLSIYN